VFASQPNNTAEPVPCRLPQPAEKKKAAAADAMKKKKKEAAADIKKADRAPKRAEA
jgi:hypothetical protein